MIEVSVPCHKYRAKFAIPEANFLGSFTPQSAPPAPDPAAEDKVKILKGLKK